MNLHKEVNFETEICEHLANNGWRYAEGDAAHYDRALALYPQDVLEWVQTTQPTAWQVLTKNHGQKAGDTLLARLRAELAARGTLDVLRYGVGIVGGKPIKLAEFKPAFGLNPDILARYKANILRVVRQVRYSQASENCLDLVLFLNGLPMATVELKSDFTQSVQDAIDQYRLDRAPKSAGVVEPLLAFPGGAPVHFAVSNSDVHMTTMLAGQATRFLPFNQGCNGAKGNPPNPHGHETAYLWEQIWARESWLEILGRYLMPKRDEKMQLEAYIFPRYHQLDVTRKLQAAVLAQKEAGKYLVQHSAGSGKTNSIAWTAHFLAELHDANDHKVFDSVLVVSDRNVIDSQLQAALGGFERTTGVVATITGNDASKSKELAEALSGDKKIVACTIQTFPAALKKVQELAATEGKNFAVIADEAHSSQSGEAAAKLRKYLSAEEQAEDDGDLEVSAADHMCAAQMEARAGTQGITFVAFTATPKAKTLELFGTLPDATQPRGDDNKPASFHVYSMRQAIEEGFILDVLQNYTTYKLAFRLAHNGKDYDDTMVERSAAMKGIMGWVQLHPHNIAQKVQVVVEHYRQHVAPLLGGRAKAMVVVGSRLEAVRWQVAINKYIREKGYVIQTLVAFSGEIKDPESFADPVTEKSKELNPNLKGLDIAEAFKGTEYQILLVANKYQTGFDQPLLCAMYVDKRLAGIQAVQTLSRLNRAHRGKDTTYVVDFKNDAQDVLESFKMYYETAQLAATTDPNIVLSIRAKLDATGYYSDSEVQRVADVLTTVGSKQGELKAALAPIEKRLMDNYRSAQLAWKAAKEAGNETAAKEAQDRRDALVLFKNDMGAYLRLYTFLSQIFNYGDVDVEKRAMFYKVLIPLLEYGREREGIDLTKVVLTHHALRSQGKQYVNLGEGDAAQVPPIQEAGSGKIQEKEKVLLDEIIKKVNELFEGELTDGDRVTYIKDVLKTKLTESKVLQQQAANNSKEQFANSPDLKKELLDAIMAAYDAHETMSKQALNSETVRTGILGILLNDLRLWETLRGQGSVSP